MSLEKRVLITNSEAALLARCGEYNKTVYIVPARENEDYNEIVKRYEHLYKVCGERVEIEIFRLELGFPEKPLRSAFSTLLAYYREFDELHVVVGDKASSTTLLVLATLLLPQDKPVKLTAVGEFEARVDVDKFVEYLRLDDVSKAVYDYLLAFGAMKLGEVERAVNKPTTTVHRKLKNLIRKGLAKESETAVFRAEPFIYVHPY